MNLKKTIEKYKWLHGRMFVNKLRRNIYYFALEGTILAILVNLYNNNNNLFAQRLGATDTQLSILMSIPQFVAMAMLLPGGIVTDRLKSKRPVVAFSMLMVGIVYLVNVFVPFMGTNRFWIFVGMLSISAGFVTIYNSSWQSYFSDVMPLGYRNKSLTIRTRGSLLMGMTIPLITGILLSSIKTNDGKIIVHQIFYFLVFVFSIIQVRTLYKVDDSSVTVIKSTQKPLAQIKETIHALSHNKGFLFFMVTVICFYMSWQIDWTVHFVARTQYLGLNEAMLSIDIVLSSIVQLISLKFWSKVNERKGVRFTIIMAGVGWTISSTIMFTLLHIPPEIGRYAFLVFNPIANFAAATIGLCFIQCLLQVLPEKNKSMSIAFYTMTTVLTNAFMPIIGITIYNKLGGDLNGLQSTFLIFAFLRAISTCLLFLRWFLLRNQPK
ncbi:MAG: MFS transporter [Lachnospirales bacterium]